MDPDLWDISHCYRVIIYKKVDGTLDHKDFDIEARNVNKKIIK